MMGWECVSELAATFSRRKAALVPLFFCIFGVCFGAADAFGQAKPPTPPALPADLNIASLRIHALDTLYELDMTRDQLNALRAAATNTASAQHRTAVKADATLAAAFKDFQAGLLTGKDDEAVAKLRNHVAGLASDVDLDDDVQPTVAAMVAAPALCHRLTASQIAAFLALHADQVDDPAEMILGVLDSTRDLRSDAAANSAAEIDLLIAQTASNASYLIDGTDDAKAAPLAAQITAFLKAGTALDDNTYAAQRAAREDSVKKIVGDVDPIAVLSNWMSLQLAELLSNPELPAAISATLAAHPAMK
jgi:hypothetical protein